MRARHHAGLIRQEVHSRHTPIMSLQRLHTLEIPRRPHYASRLLPAPTLHRPIEPSAHQKLPGFIEPQIRNHISVRRHRINRLLPPQIPHLDRVVVAPRRQLPFTAVFWPYLEPVRRESAAEHALRVSLRVIQRSLFSSYLQNQRAAPRSQVPHPADARLRRSPRGSRRAGRTAP